jgi:hypothetical protein
MILTEQMVTRLAGAVDKQGQAESVRVSGIQIGWKNAFDKLQPRLTDLERELALAQKLLAKWPYMFFATTLVGVVFGWALHAWLR